MNTNDINLALNTLKKVDYNSLYSERYKNNIKSQLMALIERIDASNTASTPAKDKQYIPTPRIDLDVPYPANAYAKRYGAKFDRDKKIWFTHAGQHNADKLVKFMSESDAVAYGFKAQTKTEPDTPLPPVKTKPMPKLNLNSPAPHIRKGHWHRYWVGSGTHRKLITKWVNACKVGY